MVSFRRALQIPTSFMEEEVGMSVLSLILLDFSMLASCCSTFHSNVDWVKDNSKNIAEDRIVTILEKLGFVNI